MLPADACPTCHRSLAVPPARDERACPDCLLRGWDWQGFEPEEPAAKTAGVWRRLVSFRSALGRAPRARVQ